MDSPLGEVKSEVIPIDQPFESARPSLRAIVGGSSSRKRRAGQDAVLVTYSGFGRPASCVEPKEAAGGALRERFPPISSWVEVEKSVGRLSDIVFYKWLR